jgi:hypothetical protein
MAREVLSLLAALTLAVVGCDKPKGSWKYPTPSPATRPSVVPSPDVLTLATQADIGAAAKGPLDPAISKAISVYLGPGAPRWKIVAARDVGDYVLLWLGFPDIADGGIDLVYSKPEQQVKWQFKGGERG